MKKIIAAIPIAVIAAVLLTGCGGEDVYVPDSIGIDEARQEQRVTLPKRKPVTIPAAVTTEVAAETTYIMETAADVTSEAVETVETTAATETEIPEEAGENPVTETETTAAEATELYYLEGTVYRTEKGEVLINEVDMDLINVSFSENSYIDSLKVGDKVLITYDGKLAETYPMRAKGYSLEVTEKAKYSYKIHEFECDNEAVEEGFSILIPENWTIKQIDYPTEGDFTDWGFRLIPQGENNGLDISWHSSFSVREAFDVKHDVVNRKEARVYSLDGKWRFCDFDNGYIAANNFYGTDLYDKYEADFDFILETINFS
ncbi:MAG: DUF3221 domain-containing protein [Ruminococcus sp.]|nr:DUF3221 domain-containing protein [Ruminococcus sp.]